jgi:hypothetical protein
VKRYSGFDVNRSLPMELIEWTPVEEGAVLTLPLADARLGACPPLNSYLQAKVKDVLLVFEQRGIDADDKSRELLESCTNLDTLNGWFRCA